MKEFADSPTELVADVDCTAAGKSLCKANGIKGYPSLKWGDPSNLETYKGGRSYIALKKFVDENLKPMCSPENIDLCDDDKKAQIKKFEDMSDKDLDAAIQEKEVQMSMAEVNFKMVAEGLQKQLEEAQKEKVAALKAIKTGGLGLMKSVKAIKDAGGNDEL